MKYKYFITSLFLVTVFTAEASDRGQFESIIEPSGITQLSNGRILIVEDEHRVALKEISLDASAETIVVNTETAMTLGGTLIERLSIGRLDDLEGIAHDADNNVYAITSHNNFASRRRADRRKLIRFNATGGAASEVSIVRDLRKRMLDAYPPLNQAIKDGKKSSRSDLNIEALAFDRSRQELLIGLRAPLVQDKAVVVRVLNPHRYLSNAESPEFAPGLDLLDLDKGGLRAMSVDDQSGQLLMVSRRDNSKKPFKLWRMALGRSQKIHRIRTEESLESVEGLTPLRLEQNGLDAILFVRDNGNASGQQMASWFSLSRTELGLDTVSNNP